MNFIKGMTKIVIGCFLLAVISTLNVTEVKAQIDQPLVPILSLVGDENESWNMSFYPDGRLWLPKQENSDEIREFLLPVFMSSNWYNYYGEDNTRRKYIPKPIKSFKFSLMYDEYTIEPIGVEVVPPEYLGDLIYPEDVLAREFSFVCEEMEDDMYLHYINESKWENNPNEAERGKRYVITATASGNSFLPASSGANRGRKGGYDVLLFVRFRVVTSKADAASQNSLSGKPLYIDNREVVYNRMNVATNLETGKPFDPVWSEFSDYDLSAETQYSGINTYLAGIDNSDLPQEYSKMAYRDGSIAVCFFDQLPEFQIISNESTNPIVGYPTDAPEPGLWTLTSPITTDSNATETANIICKLHNKVPLTRIMHPIIQTDKEWLEFRTEPSLGQNPIPNPITFSRSHIPYIDNGTLGPNSPDPLGSSTTAQEPIYLRLAANTDIIDAGGFNNGGEERTGYYESWITFRAPYANVNPIRVRVPFMYFKNPEERPEGSVNATGGITLELSNNDPAVNPVKLVFGTGTRATDGWDYLYGESIYTGPLSTTNLDARFFISKELYEEHPGEQLYQLMYENGFADVAPNRYNPRTRSRDIRANDPGITTYTYHCKFNSGGTNKYPVVLSWNVKDFPENALVYLRDTENGKLFPAIDMRKGTLVEDTPEREIRTYTFTDASIKEFFIEYSLPQQFEFVDEQGDPCLQPGWNLVSMPVLPMNTRFENVYPNAINIPYTFTANDYQDVKDNELQFGRGYFVKYSTDLAALDRKFVGAKLTEIPEPIKVYPTDKENADPNDPNYDEYGGWNLVGTVSYPTSIENLSLIRFGTGVAPDPEFTYKFGFWRYYPKLGYQEVSMLQPGFGYWIKTNETGYYQMRGYPGKTLTASNTSLVQDNSVKVIVTDNSQNEGTLYISNDKNINVSECQLPPCPPQEVFDIRFEGGYYLTSTEGSVIELQGVEYPANIYIEDAPADYVFTDVITGKVFGSISKGFSGNIYVESTSANAIKMSKVASENDEVAGLEVYPNPVKATSYVNFTLASDSYVSVKLYDAIGNEVMTIKEGQLNAGTYSEELSNFNLPAGNYICRMVDGENSFVTKITVIK